MANTAPPVYSRGLQLYIVAVCAAGATAVAFSLGEVLQQPDGWRYQWLALVLLTALSGLLPVQLPSVQVSISISETFVIAGTLLFGPAGGTVLVLLDALFISIRLYLAGVLRWQQVLFNLAAPPISVWIAAHVAGIVPIVGTELDFNGRFFFGLAAFTTIYFLLNSWLITFALALQRNLRPTTIWRKHFVDLLINYGAAASVASLMVYNTRTVKVAFVAAIAPLLLMLYLTYKWSNRRIEVEREKVAELNRVFLSTIEALALAIDAKDQVTHGHIRRVQRYTMGLAKALGVQEQKQIDALKAAALLHDTGKLAVPEYILNKPGPLTASEFERMKVHAAVGADILKSIDFPYPVEPIVRHHHEAWDGSGYPGGLKGQDIPLGARILSVVDCYDALTSDRPYRPRMTRPQAEQVLRDRRGKSYDPWVVDRFLESLDQLEAAEVQEGQQVSIVDRPAAQQLQLDAITATTAEEREFNELRRELPRSSSLGEATEVLFKHLKRVVPLSTLALYRPRADANELAVVAACGTGASAFEGITVPIAERISGWVFANGQSVLNSDATLELGPVARTFPSPLRYVIAVPIMDKQVVAVLAVFSTAPFDTDHKRLLENASTLFVSSLSQPIHPEQPADAPKTTVPTSRVH